MESPPLEVLKSVDMAPRDINGEHGGNYMLAIGKVILSLSTSAIL